MIVIIAGGRDYLERRGDMDWLKRLADNYHIRRIVHGGAMGADELGSRLADALDLELETHPVLPWIWEMVGRGAGPMRNEYMVKRRGAQAAVIFPGGRGTADLERRARAAGMVIFKPYSMEAEQ